jgi:xanthine dehydrogenase YagS FAD-binding subunit
MRPFRFVAAADRPAAIELADGTDAKVLGGGTNLVDLMKLGVEEPSVLIGLTGLGLNGIDDDGAGGLRIGASVRNSDLAGDARVRDRFEVLAHALLAGASGQLRNMATVGGNLLQRTRCSYFQDVSKPCNKRRPGSGCPAVNGAHRNLAILGASPQCVATHPSDMAVALAALDARVEIEDRSGMRSLGVSELYRLPGTRPDLDTNLPVGALVTSVGVPALAEDARSSYVKARDRASFGFALAAVGAVLRVTDGKVADVRVALGGVAHMPWRARVAEAELLGAPADPARFRSAIDRELAEARPLRDNGYKVALVRSLVVRSLSALAGAVDSPS